MLYFSTGPLKHAGILENLGSGILYTYDVCPNLCPKIGRLCTWKFVLHKFSILDISATVRVRTFLMPFFLLSLKKRNS